MVQKYLKGTCVCLGWDGADHTGVAGAPAVSMDVLLSGSIAVPGIVLDPEIATGSRHSPLSSGARCPVGDTDAWLVSFVVVW